MVLLFTSSYIYFKFHVFTQIHQLKSKAICHMLELSLKASDYTRLIKTHLHVTAETHAIYICFPRTLLSKCSMRNKIGRGTKKKRKKQRLEILTEKRNKETELGKMKLV